ncbi:hypothetical protein [Methylobacterium nigriterrae]|uniref:hypothetical protein n=1 Tax=Methylobacterium nigriterrae TaxID=3127512 RepID=UPI0030133DF8
MLLLVFTAIGGGLATAGLMWPQGAMISVLSAPLGGSLCALTAACLLATRRGPHWQDEHDLDRQTDEMVAALRGVSARAGEGETAAAARKAA